MSKREIINMIGIKPSRFYNWCMRKGIPNQHNGKQPRSHWILPEEREAIIKFCRNRLGEGYRRLTYMMLDLDVAAVSPSTTYRVLKEAGLLNRWSTKRTVSKGQGFDHPDGPHKHWHLDISYVNILGTIFFLITVMDGFSRMILHHELRTSMTEYDVEITVQRAREKYISARPKIISDNGRQFISKDFKEFIRVSGFTHVRTSPHYPQSNGKLERFYGTLKQEEIRRKSYLSLKDARNHIAVYIQYYNNERLHSALFYLSPRDVFEGHMASRLAERQYKLNQAQKMRRFRSQQLEMVSLNVSTNLSSSR